MELETEAPCPIASDDGPSTTKVGACTVMLRLLVTVRLPEVPVMVRLAGPPTALLLADRVSTLLVAVGFALQEAVTPAGSPLTDRFTFPLNPYSGVTTTLVDAVAPWFSPRLAGDGVIVNVGP